MELYRAQNYNINTYFIIMLSMHFFACRMEKIRSTFNQLIQNIIDNCQPIENNKPYIEMYHFYLQLMYGFIFFNSNYSKVENIIDNFFNLIKNEKKLKLI